MARPACSPSCAKGLCARARVRVRPELIEGRSFLLGFTTGGATVRRRELFPEPGSPIRPGCRRKPFDFVRPARDGVGHLVADGLTFPRDLAHRIADASAGLLVLLGGRVAKIA